jgi:tripartite ATP-independent transporter DctM subunit
VPLEYIALMMVGAFFVLVLTGMPVAFAIAAVGFVFGFIGFDGWLFELLPSRIYGTISNYTLLAIPLFVFMGVMLDKTRVAERMLEVIGYASGALPGGMALAVIAVGVLLGAATGIVGAAIVTLTLIALPTLLRRGYKRTVACGTICAAGTLGQIIPPSLVLLVLADTMNLSVGSLFAAALVPGLMLAGLYVLYLMTLAWFYSADVPAIDAAERAKMSKRQIVKDLFTAVLPPGLLVAAVLGSIIAGIAAPTEAAAVGAVGAVVVALIMRRLSWPVFSDAVMSTVRITAMVFFVLIASQVFALAFRGLDGEFLIEAMFNWVPGGAYGTLLFILLADLPARFLPGVDPDHLHRGAAVPALPRRLPRVLAGMDRDPHRDEPADLLPDATLRLVADLHEGGSPAGHQDHGNLPRRRALRDHPAGRPGPADPVPRHRPLAARRDRLVGLTRPDPVSSVALIITQAPQVTRIVLFQGVRMQEASLWPMGCLAPARRASAPPRAHHKKTGAIAPAKHRCQAWETLQSVRRSRAKGF